MSHTAYAVTTKLGELRVTPTEAAHIHVEGELTTRGVTYRASTHLYRWTDGQFHIGQEFTKAGERSSEWEQRRDMYVNRTGSAFQANHTDVSNAAKNALIAAIEPAVQAWAAATPAALIKAQRDHIEEEIEASEAAIVQAEADLETQRAALVTARQAIIQLQARLEGLQ